MESIRNFRIKRILPIASPLAYIMQGKPHMHTYMQVPAQ